MTILLLMCRQKRVWLLIGLSSTVKARVRLSLWVGGLLHQSFLRDQFLYNPVASVPVGNFAIETIHPLFNRRIVAPGFALQRV